MEETITTLIAWVAIDQRGPSSLYFASDSRITWGSPGRRWDVGRKLFACKKSPDIFGYVGEVLFPSLVLGQLIDAVDHDILFSLSDDPAYKHAEFVRTVQSSFGNRHEAPNDSFEILHATRVGNGVTAMFRIWLLIYTATSKSWSDNEIQIPTACSGLIVARGTGASSRIPCHAIASRKPGSRQPINLLGVL